MRRLLLVVALVAVALTAGSGVVHAAGSTSLRSPTDVELEGAYAYFTSYPGSTKRYVQVVVKTKGQMPRRHDGLIRASGVIDGRTGAGSTGSVNGRRSRCYTFSAALKNGRFYGSAGKPGEKATAGSRHTVTFSATDQGGKKRSATRTITLRDKHAGDDTGAPLHC